MKFQYDRSFTFVFHDEEWEAYLITAEEFKEISDNVDEDDSPEDLDDDSIAMVLNSKRCLFITEGYIDKVTIGHELYHMFVKYFYIESADLTIDQFEEINAEFLGDDVDKFVRIRDELYNKYKELK